MQYNIFALMCIVALGVLGGAAAFTGDEPQLETSPLTQAAQRANFNLQGEQSAFKFRFSDPEVSAVTDNAAVLQQRVTKASNPFLSTLSEPGESQFLTALKPCSILLPHVHQRANEFYTVIYGTMDAGIAQENGAAQDITLEVQPGEVFIVPKGLLHYNHNSRCIPSLFLQTFTSSDPGAINVLGALAAIGNASDAGAAAIAAASAEFLEPSPQGSFSLDQECLQRCGMGVEGAYGDGLEELPVAFRALLGL